MQTLGIFAVIPIAAFLLIALLVVAPSWARDARYRPGLPWNAEPVWFEGPDSTSAEASGGTGEPAHGESTDGGGASATW